MRSCRSLPACLVAALTLQLVASQDDGQRAAQLAQRVAGTLPNAAAFQASATQQAGPEAAAGRLPSVAAGAACQGQGERAQAAGRPNATAPTGILRLGLSGSGRDGYVFVPSSYQASAPSALVVALHGAGKGGLDGLGVLVDKANSSGVILVAPDSRGATWDWFLTSSFGPDVAFLAAALAQARALYSVDAARLGMQGFSDGATYALSLGLANGGLFSRVMANSPGGILPIVTQGRPPVFVSAGVQDTLFPIGQGGDSVVCELQGRGYNVTYDRFQGGHVLPPAAAAGMVDWFLGRGALASAASPLCPGST